jgi:retron-type reverse transcriptase
MVSLLADMLSNRQFRVFVKDKSSKVRFLNNGLPQGSVLSQILFNLYTSYLPPTNSRKFIYADDLAMAYQHQNFENVENRLSDDFVKYLFKGIKFE